MGKKDTGKDSILKFYTATCKNSANTRSTCGINLSRLKKGLFRSILWFTIPQDMRQANNSKSAKKINHLFKTLLVQFIAKSLLNLKIIAIPFTSAFFKMAVTLFQNF
ncbi:Ubiquitin fusion degradation protein 4 [Mucor circinelloides]